MGCRIVYFFYPADNPHKKMAQLAEATLSILPDVPDLLPVRSNVAVFKLEDLKKENLDFATSSKLIEKARLLTSSDRCCRAINCANNPKKRKRCSGSSKADSTLCSRHFKQDQLFKLKGDGKAVTLVEEASSLRLNFDADMKS